MSVFTIFSSFPSCQSFPTTSHLNRRSTVSEQNRITIFTMTNTENADSKSCNKSSKSKSRRLYSFKEARKIARGHGFSSRLEFIEYDCAGAYQLPKDADVVWKDEWRGWDDFLGVPLSFHEVNHRD